MINKVMFYCKFLDLAENRITHRSDLKDASLLLIIL